MGSPGNLSPRTYKHLKCKPKRSPVELKNLMRKNYKGKVQNCRNVLIDKFRGPIADLKETLNEIYKSIPLSDDFNFELEYEVLEQIQDELVQEETEWWQQVYEQSQMDNMDWSAMETDDNVLCPLCKKANLSLLVETVISCSSCKANINTTKSLFDIKQSLMCTMDKHNSTCDNDVQFTLVSELNEAHVYFVCDACKDMQFII